MSRAQTANVQAFVAANAESPVVSGAAYQRGGGRYTLENGKSFTFTLIEARSIGAPIRWVHDQEKSA